jgi:ribosomal protein S13
MPRVLGVDIPNNKPTHVALTYLYGIGPVLVS